ncbi:MAG: biotin--[acetyl-CoA-carboxylase] ligase [Candidatus Abyssobacteria bacterium SURF_17]|jgi:BirA family biotin operon repressor/biotin-[acetyl-CoA-carboxylase] ligase|uniref:Bifunctional ligase/repressor BirA n=1 Tax=Candidatus Abyssobacteria bacterium SURF_17 TaxID=2093361 RepID=A0A419F6A5_9BACT|nr:MAG: biotin--[acetyl-CoA-carboxylase] ligase [Candidatus Abyssubacteria bacterium SURF_17]
MAYATGTLDNTLHERIPMEKEILKLLRHAEGAYVSGQAMSHTFGVSRSAVWKSVASLRKMGFRIGSCANRGYRFEAAPERIVGLDIEADLDTRIIGQSVVSFDSVPSTIDVAGSLASEGCAEGTVIVAESQTGGRGRLGRKWSSPSGCGVWASIVLRPAMPPRDVPKLTLLTAVAVAKVLSEQYTFDARIKWPNDVTVNGRKICGALTELVAEQDAVRHVIASFGLNVNQTPSMFPAEVAAIATSMRIEKGEQFDRPEVFRRVLREFDTQYVHFKQHGSGNVLKQWRDLSCTLGRHVRVQMREGYVEGIARDLDDDGSLIVEEKDGSLRPVSHGDVTIVR